MLVAYIAGYQDPNEAKAAVVRAVGAIEGDDVREPSPVSDETVAALGVKPTNVWML